MGLSKKTFLYSMLLAAAMVAFITGYFLFMLPSLYVSYVMDSHLKSVTEIQAGYMKSRSYDNLTVKNPSATYSVEIPQKGSELFITGKFFRLTVDVKDQELQECLSQIRRMMASATDDYALESPSYSPSRETSARISDSPSRKDFADLWALLKEKLTEKAFFPGDYPLGFQIEEKSGQGVYREEYSRFHMPSEDFIVWETGVSDSDYSYTTYIAAGATEDAFIFTVLPTMTPQMEEIRPVVTGSMPMIVAVVFLLVLLSSRFFSGKIVNPIIRLAGDAKNASLTQQFETTVFDLHSNDEIGELSRALSELYQKLRESYLELTQKNKSLEEENLRQEVFLRATSHQLKTPIAAALLLTDGMIDGIGKYRDSRAFLPEVKKQLLSMRKIVEDILYLNYHTERMVKEPVSLETLVREVLNAYAVQIESAKLDVSFCGSGVVPADRDILKKIIDNLLSNAVQYTPPGNRIEIKLTKKTLRIQNYGTTIAESLLPGIFKPFVTSNAEKTGRGLGLYVASYYSRLSGIRLSVENAAGGGEPCVRALLTFPDDSSLKTSGT